MRQQLTRLLDVGELPNLSLRMMPFDVGLHLGVMSGPFVILRFPLNGDGTEAEPPTVYVDGFTGALYLDKPNEIDRYDGAYSGIWDTALAEGPSRALIHQAVRELEE